MAQAKHTPRIDTAKGRKLLPARKNPYWLKLEQYQYLGYRKLPSGVGTWTARFTAGTKFVFESLGNDDALTFEDACRLARRFFQSVGAGVDAEYTVNACLDDYQRDLGLRTTEAGARLAVNRLRKHLPDSWGDAKLRKLDTVQIRRWRDSMVSLNPDREIVRRSQDSANRVLATFKAAANLAWRSGVVTDDSPWRRVSGFKAAGKARTLFLTDTQVIELLGATEGGFRELLEAALLTGARYGELSGARVADFDPDDRTLLLSGKTGARHATLSDSALALFKRLARGKLPKAWLLLRDDGAPWRKSQQSRPMRDAVRTARLPSETVFYSCRHYYISKALIANIPAQLIAEHVGTSTRMIEKTYGKFRQADRVDLLNRVEVSLP